MNPKLLIYTAKFISLLFSPFYLPVTVILLLFAFSYLQLWPFQFKLVILALVFGFTVALPMLSMWVYRKLNGWTRHEASRRELRSGFYLISIMCYGSCFYMMDQLHLPHFLLSVLLAAFVLQVVCVLLHRWVHVSVHSAAAAAVVGALMAFSLLFAFNPLWWLCLAILVTGCVGTSRLILRRHQLHEVGWGMLIGLLVGFCTIFYF